DNGMGRFSHGFRAIDFNKIKTSREADGRTTAPGGFDVKVYEIMEESLVSVPSNTDADTEEIMLSLIESDKMKSPLMKNFGRNIREHRPKQFALGGAPINLNLTVSLDGKAIGDANVSGNRSTEAKG